MKTIKRFLPWITLTAGLVVGAAAGYFFAQAEQEAQTIETPDAQIRVPGYTFIRPLLECETDESTFGPTPRELRYFKDDLERIVHSLEDERRVRVVAVYFRDLDNGPWIGVKEEKTFTPASLFKVPLIMAVFKQSEIIPGWLDTRLKYRGLPDAALGQYHFPPAATLEIGKEYAIMDLLNRVATFSDNGATLTLQEAIDPSILSNVYKDLGLDPTKTLYGKSPTITAETYGRFFRILYNATYLSRKHSELALQAFSRSTFKEGLVAGVPEGTIVSHKFGEKMTESGGERIVQLHDVGIVYHPRKPYLLCILTLGTDYEAQAGAIASVSRFIWNEIGRNTETPTGP